jgi:outer membrane protein assembly factor BamB
MSQDHPAAPPPPVPPILITAFNGYVVALDPRTGAIAWELPERLYGATPRLYVTATYSLVLGGGYLACFDTQSGHLHWRAETFGVTLLYPGGDLIFSAAYGEVECFAIRTGQRLWHQEFKGKGHAPVALGVPGVVAQLDQGR